MAQPTAWDKRRAPRQKVFGPALILGPKLEVNCVIRDLSATGAKLEIPALIKLPQAFNLMLLKTNSSRHVRLKWRKGDYAGVQFVLPDDAGVAKDERHPASSDPGRTQPRAPGS
ncbi:MAG TPA: PilZ domain-containing protein [Beijerinckiaceae bacterium]|jgi:hypothetical protein